MKWSTKAIIKCSRKDDNYELFGNGEELVIQKEGRLQDLLLGISDRLEDSYRNLFFEWLSKCKENNQKEKSLKIRYADKNGNLCWYGLQYVEDGERFWIVWEEISRQIGFEKADKNNVLRLNERERLLVQINGHLLFNTMNVVKGYMQYDLDLAGETINLLAKSMRLGMEMLREEGPVSFEKELQYMILKIKIEQQCYENLRYNTDCEILDFYVPPFSLQRLLEGIMEIGMLELEKEQQITIKTCEAGDNIEICLGFYNTFLQERPLEDREAIVRIEELMEGQVSDVIKGNENVSIKILLPKRNAMKGVYII